MKRPNIPDHIKLKLWVLSGGRCEFPGCNKYVWQDGLTLREDNYAHMAHLIAASPAGPRGDDNLSPELTQNFDNLILVCLDHSKLIDGKNKDDYTIEELKRYKQSHEDRIRRQTALQPEMTTIVLRFMANIGDRPVEIGLRQAHQAILPRFPADDRGILMDFINRPGRGESAYWESFADEISRQVERELSPGNGRPRPEHISIFALGPIPLLIHLGRMVGNTISADIYQRHRDTEDWRWKSETEDQFEYKKQEFAGMDEKNIALVLSLSGKVHHDEVYRSFKEKPLLIEIMIESPNPGFLNQKSKLQKFREVYRKTLSEIRQRYGADVTIHLFPAVPSPVAITCGRELLPKSDPKVIVYDHEIGAGGFIKILSLN